MIVSTALLVLNSVIWTGDMGDELLSEWVFCSVSYFSSTFSRCLGSFCFLLAGIAQA